MLIDDSSVMYIRFTTFAFAVKLRKYGSKKADAVVEKSFARYRCELDHVGVSLESHGLGARAYSQ